ncbi:MAG TPA: GspH/FimT family pseudopilin [Tepidisphaeraceae bacterium]|jgi:type II secretion system protein H|nr:GspH/FimT family pseudopilin [Tepidisphaeraceae bacterium]
MFRGPVQFRPDHPSAGIGSGCHRGFTLLELILVMAILAVVVAMVAPSLSVFANGRQTNYAASRIVSMAEYARTQAINEGRIYRLNFDPSARACWITAQNGPVFQDTSSDLGGRAEASEGVIIRTDIQAQSDGMYVAFRPDGRTDPAKIFISDKQGRELEIACLSSTERFRILRPEEMTP